MDNIEMLYAMECYGDIPSRQGKINKALQELEQIGSFDPVDIDLTLADQGIYDISPAEYDYISEHIKWLS